MNANSLWLFNFSLYLANVFVLDLGSETEERHILPKNFYYDYDDIVSKPRVTEGVPEDMFKL